MILKGRPISSVAARAAGATKSAKVAHVNAPLGSTATAFMDGGFVRRGRDGLGGARRIILTSLSNFRSGLKIQAIGTIIDLIGDANTVFGDEKGSHDLSEFLGRAGVSIAKAGATAALGSAIVAFGLGLGGAMLGTAALPVALVVLVIIGGFVFAATAVDKVDEAFLIKEKVAARAR